MKKLAFIGLAFAAMLSAAPASAQSNSPVFNQTVSGAIDITVSQSVTNTVTKQKAVDKYNGFQGFANAEHGGFVQTRTDGAAAAGGVTINGAKSNFNGNGVQGAGSISGSTEAVSGSVAAAGSIGSGSSRVDAAGYAAGSVGGRFENGTATTRTQQNNTTAATRLTGTGSLSATR